VRELTTQGVSWSSEEDSDLVAPPLNLERNIHLRMFAYTSNFLITGFEYMELMISSGTLKNFFAKVSFVHRPCGGEPVHGFVPCSILSPVSDLSTVSVKSDVISSHIV
jgi:hypothetical protein